MSDASADMCGRGASHARWILEMDIYDGYWVVGLRTNEPKWHLVRLHVTGQPAITIDPLKQEDPVGVSTYPAWPPTYVPRSAASPTDSRPGHGPRFAGRQMGH
jgi:hypothetical protein